jgi:Mg-chelatase subunit ChlD
VGSFRFTWPTTLGPSRPSILEPFGIDSLFADWQQHEIVAVMQGGLGGLHLQGADERDGTTKWAVPLWQYTRNNDPLTFQESDGSVSPNGTIALQWGPWSRLDSTENPLGAVTQLTRDGRFESITRFDFQPVPSAQLLSETWSRVRVADMGTQTLVLYPRAGQYAVFQAGREIALRNAPPFALDLAADADGIVVRGWDGVDGRITMLSSDGNQVWTRSCNCQLSTGIALDKTHVLVIDSLRDKLLVFERSDGTPIAQWPLRKAGSAPLVDVAGIESKYAAVIDSSGVVQVIDVETGAIRSTLIAKAGLPAQAIAANGDTLVLLTQDQSVEVISNSGQSLQRWSLPAEVHASDVSIDQAGQIHVLDFGGKSLLLFGLDQTMPAGEIAPGEPLLQSDTVCGASGMATTNTSSVRLGALVTLSIEAAFRCLSKPQHVDIVVVLNPNRQQLYLYDSARIDEVLRQMQPVLNRDQWRISLVADDPSTNTVRVVAPFGTDETTWNQQIDQLIRPANDSLNEVRPGLDVMATVALNYLRIESSAERLQVIVLVDEPAGAVTAESKLSDFRATGGVVQELQLLGMFPPSLTELSLEKGIDTRIPVGPLGDIAVLATDLARRSGQTPPRDVTLELVVSREVMLEPDSIQPPALQQDQELRWWFASLGDPYTDVRLAVRPTRLGTVSIAEPARLIYTDHAGQRRYIDIPVPTVDVIDVQLTPQAFNTPTSTATSSLVSATPSGSRRVFLPTLLHLLCDGADRNADVVLALDTSTSMLEPTSPGGKSKLDSAREAARTFLQMMVPRRDQAALIQFNSSATTLVDLSDQPALAIAALDRLSVDEGTNISHALNIGVNILAGPRRRASNNAVFILLTDGVPTGTTHEEVRQAAIEAQRAAMVFTIGVGQFVDRALLQSMASQPAYSYFAPNSADLNTIYQAIAYSIPCRSGWP